MQAGSAGDDTRGGEQWGEAPGGLNVFYLLFGLSGFSGLIYESIWSHYIRLFLGHSAYAQTLVLAIFMGGMAAGAWICGRFSCRWRNLLLGYALAEAVIGVFALLFHDAFDRIVGLSFQYVMPRLAASQAVTLYQWGLSALLILPQSVLIGMPFPLMAAGLLRISRKNQGKSLSTLYFANSLGAALGVLASGFLLIRLVGLPGTIRIAGLINLALAVIVWRLVRGKEAALAPCPEPGTGSGRRDKSLCYRLFLVASFLTGAASFIYEVGWIRMLSLVLGSSTHAFELMLSAFIFGLAFGGFWIRRRLDSSLNPAAVLAAAQIFMGVCALLTLPLYGWTFEAMQWILRSVGKTDASYAFFNLASYGICLAMMLPATFCAGMTLPLITLVLIRQGHGERSIGAVYAANTLGAIAGVLFAVHAGMPFLGLKGLITSGAGVDVSLGIVLMWSGATGLKGRRPLAFITAGSAFAVAVVFFLVQLDPYKMASGVYRYGNVLSSDENQIVYHRDGKTATVTVSTPGDGLMSIRTNGKVDAGISIDPAGEVTADEVTMVLAAAIPMSLHPEAKTVANIGLGSGLTTHVLLSNPAIDHVDTVEIEEFMVEAARRFSSRSGLAFTDPRSEIHIDDAKSFFAAHNHRYDIIISEPSNPWVSGVANLFSVEFYRQVSRHLKDGGLFVQWMQLYEVDMDLVASVLKAMSKGFTDYEVFATNDTNILIVGRCGGQVPRPTPEVFGIPELSAALARVDVRHAQDLEVRRLGTKEVFDRLVETFPAPPNSDYHPFLDQNAARTRFMRAMALDLHTISVDSLPVLDLLDGPLSAEVATEVTPSSFFSKTDTVYTAMALRDYFLQGTFGGKYEAVPEELRRKASVLRQAAPSSAPVVDETIRMECIFDLATCMVPFLRSHELDAVWDRLEGTGAVRRTVEREWLSFFRSLGRRDAAVAARKAEELLAWGEGMPLHAARYLVTASMLGYLSAGDYGQASRIWMSHRTGICDQNSRGAVMRILASSLERDRAVFNRRLTRKEIPEKS